MTRRAFFATLLAPFAARFAPKPKSGGQNSVIVTFSAARAISTPDNPYLYFMEEMSYADFTARYPKFSQWKPLRFITLVEPDGSKRLVPINLTAQEEEDLKYRCAVGTGWMDSNLERL